MTPFSMPTQKAIEAFAAKMGMSCRPAADNSYGFHFERTGTLSILQSNEDACIIVSLTRNRKQLDASAQRRLLNMAGLDLHRNMMIYSAMLRGGTCIIAVSIEENIFDERALDEALFMLSALHDSIDALSQT